MLKAQTKYVFTYLIVAMWEMQACCSQERYHEIWQGGGIQVCQHHLPPNYDFSSDFGHFILKADKT